MVGRDDGRGLSSSADSGGEDRRCEERRCGDSGGSRSMAGEEHDGWMDQGWVGDGFDSRSKMIDIIQMKHDFLPANTIGGFLCLHSPRMVFRPKKEKQELLELY